MKNGYSRRIRSPDAPRGARSPNLWSITGMAAPERGGTVRDISLSGAYILTPERWYLGTIVRIILQGIRTNAEMFMPRTVRLQPASPREW